MKPPWDSRLARAWGKRNIAIYISKALCKFKAPRDYCLQQSGSVPYVNPRSWFEPYELVNRILSSDRTPCAQVKFGMWWIAILDCTRDCGRKWEELSTEMSPPPRDNSKWNPSSLYIWDHLSTLRTTLLATGKFSERNFTFRQSEVQVEYTYTYTLCMNVCSVHVCVRVHVWYKNLRMWNWKKQIPKSMTQFLCSSSQGNKWTLIIGHWHLATTPFHSHQL